MNSTLAGYFAVFTALSLGCQVPAQEHKQAGQVHSLSAHASLAFSESDRSYLQRTLVIMTNLDFRVRDTFSMQHNLDDFYANGKKYDGPRRFQIQWIDTNGFCQCGANLCYKIPGLSSISYDGYRIRVASRYKSQGRDDPIVHECVHFLQHITYQEETNYVEFAGTNYEEYVCQRSEFEAHIVQIAYIFDAEPNWLEKKLTQPQRLTLTTMLDHYRKTHTPDTGITIIMICKNAELI